MTITKVAAVKFPLPSKIYFRLRLLMLPIRDIHENLPKKGKILDLGCGNGGLSLALAKLSKQRQLIGWDLDQSRIRDATKTSSRNRSISFEVKDILTSRIPRISGAVASDFLHHLPRKAQEALIKKVYLSLGKSGVLIIKETDQDDSIRHELSKFWDRLFYPNDKTSYRGSKEWIELLERIGFLVLSKSCVLWFPGSTRLFICKKK